MRRPTIFLTLAVVAAFLAAIVVFSALRNREAQMKKAMGQTTDIVVAARDVQLGTRLEIADLKLTRWSHESVPAGAYTDLSTVSNEYARTDLVAGQPIVPRDVVSAARIPGVM